MNMELVGPSFHNGKCCNIWVGLLECAVIVPFLKYIHHFVTIVQCEVLGVYMCQCQRHS